MTACTQNAQEFGKVMFFHVIANVFGNGRNATDRAHRVVGVENIGMECGRNAQIGVTAWMETDHRMLEVWIFLIAERTKRIHREPTLKTFETEIMSADRKSKERHVVFMADGTFTLLLLFKVSGSF
jgi:hypothetical protein